MKRADLVYLALSVLSTEGRGAVMPELLYILSPDQLYNLVKMLGGRAIRVPTAEEYKRGLLTALYIYHRGADRKGDGWFMERYGVGKGEFRRIRSRYRRWMRSEAKRDILVLGDDREAPNG